MFRSQLTWFCAFKHHKSHRSHCVAFETDEDEDGDRITVRSDEEMKAMLSYVSRHKIVTLQDENVNVIL